VSNPTLIDGNIYMAIFNGTHVVILRREKVFSDEFRSFEV